MSTFQVLDRKQNVHQNYFLEASAGTGKTFSIENIVVRLLIEKDPLSIEQILIVTFTRAATNDLKIRIRKMIVQAKEDLTRGQSSIDYLSVMIQEGKTEQAIRQLEMALFSFDQAQIYTIHSFCARMLRDHLLEGGNTPEGDEENTIANTDIVRVVRDFFRTGITNETYSREQLNRLLKQYGNTVTKLEHALVRQISSRLAIEKPRDFHSLFSEFCQVMTTIDASSLEEDFLNQAPYYKGFCDRKGVVKDEILLKAMRFANICKKNGWNHDDFNTLIEDGIVILFDPDSKMKRKGEPPKLLNGEAFDQIRHHLLPLVDEARSIEMIFARMASDCQKMLNHYLVQEEKQRYDDLLLKMSEALHSPTFCKNVRKQYRAAIIDEFQDTDPLQWEIFNRLFLRDSFHHCFLYLVGDPKQSIYAFRQADIYTFLSAEEEMGEKAIATLSTNYRSQPVVVKCLNHLFAACKNFMELPSIKKCLPFQPVDASPKESSQHEGVHLCYVDVNEKKYSLEQLEEHNFFPFLVEEILRLDLPFNSYAVLVADRFQAERVADFLKLWKIPATMQRQTSLAQSEALLSIREVLYAVIHPRDMSALKVALGGRIFGWTDHDVKELEDTQHLESILLKFQHLRSLLMNVGIAAFFDEVLALRKRHILQEEEGKPFLDDLHQIVELILDYEMINHVTTDGLLRFLDDFEMRDYNDDERIKRRPDPSEEAVVILTMHTSKGLEFPVVFPIGLIKRSPAPSMLVPIKKGNEYVLIPTPDTSSERYLHYCQECDAEKMRQLYVALTRAKERLYLPVISAPSVKPPLPGCASPMELFLHKLNGLEAMKEIIGSFTALKDRQFHLKMFTADQSLKLEPPPDCDIHFERIPVLSFSSLTKPSSVKLVEAPHDINNEEKNPHTLPAGSDIGNLLHHIFEEISFQDHVCLHTLLKETVYHEWEETITTIVRNALQTPLEDGFSLSEITAENLYREMEFLYPVNAEIGIEEVEFLNGYLKGFIDLIFLYDNHYYILDWKSNWLGPSNECYTRQKMEEAMHHHQYFLQAQVYREALKRYLAIVDPRPFKQIYGGTYYLFLRGVSEGKGMYKVEGC